MKPLGLHVNFCDLSEVFISYLKSKYCLIPGQRSIDFEK